MTVPVAYSTPVEQPQPDEAGTVQALKESFRTILDTTSEDYGHAVCAVHAKGRLEDLNA